MMAHTAPAQPFPLADTAGQRLPLAVTVLDSLAAAEPAWRALESRAVLTPYQRFDWIAGLLDASDHPPRRIAVAVVARGGETVALLPLEITKRLGLRVATLMGTEQSNCDWMIALPGFQPDAAALGDIFAQIAQAVGGIDLMVFHNLPQSWNGETNPLLHLPQNPAASNLYRTGIAGVPKPFIDHRLIPKRRGDLRRSRRRMEEAMAPVRLVRIGTIEEFDRIHAAFLEQRGTRFDEMGIDNIFSSDLFRRFFRNVAIASFGDRRPALVVHALMGGNEIAATAWGTTQGDHYSLYINSTQSGEASKFSLMHILIADLMDELIEEGFTSFDIGLGDFSYKERWTEAQPVFDALVPLTALGRLAARVQAGRTAIKRTIKQNPALWEAATRVRRVLHRFRPPNE